MRRAIAAAGYGGNGGSINTRCDAVELIFGRRRLVRMITPIIQFGTSRFLQAHADLFISEAWAGNEAIERITVVHSSGDSGRASCLAGLTRQGGFEVRVEGLRGGEPVRESVDVTSVARAISAADDQAELHSIFAEEIDLVLSNTSDAGWAARPADAAPAFHVSQPLDPAGAVCEPYALWAIEDRPGLVVPCRHRDVQVVADLQRLEALKLHILNLGHTYLVDRWLVADRSPGQYVRELMSIPAIVEDLREVYDAEVIPTFALAGFSREVLAYVDTTIDRFSNPFLNHRLSDIAQNHAEKVRRRIAAFLEWGAQLGIAAPQPRLREVLNRNRQRA